MNQKRIIQTLLSILRIVVFFIIVLTTQNCKKIDVNRIVKINTLSVTDLSYTSCGLNGEIIDLGESDIIQHGFCWGETFLPSITDNSVSLGPKSELGDFTFSLSGLDPDTEYYVRAYAEDKNDVYYADETSFRTLSLTKATVTTEEVSNMTVNSIQCGGEVINDGGNMVTARGVCWADHSSFSISDFHTTDGTGIGSFISVMTDLLPETDYYVKAYVTTSLGTSYGEIKEFNLGTVQELSTISASNITKSSALCGGIITSDGGALITQRGICWRTSSNPTVADTKTIDSDGIGNFSSELTGLSAGTKYFVRAYASNSRGTVYGNEIEFTTYRSDAETDIDGNYFNIVTIVTQTWMAENLKTTKYNDGNDIPLIENQYIWDNLETPGYCWYDNDQATFMTDYGAIYNKYAVNTGKLCPSGWHVPDIDEWTTLVNYCGGENSAGNKLKEAGESHWVNNFSGTTNESGFTALPGGSRISSYYSLGEQGSWWISTSSTYNNTRTNASSASSKFVIREGSEDDGFSVRCIKD